MVPVTEIWPLRLISTLILRQVLSGEFGETLVVRTSLEEVLPPIVFTRKLVST